MIKLAKWILSVTANSASCERLFSVFGNTLTKLRNRTGTKTLHNLAEIKLHIQNQHQEKKTGARICKIFEQRATPAAPPTFDPPILPHGMQIDPELELICSRMMRVTILNQLQKVLGGSHVQFLSCLTSQKPTGQHFIQRQHYSLLMKNYKPMSCWTWMHREKMMWM